MYALIERIIEVFYHVYVIAYNNQTRVFDRKLRETLSNISAMND